MQTSRIFFVKVLKTQGLGWFVSTLSRRGIQHLALIFGADVDNSDGMSNPFLGRGCARSVGCIARSQFRKLVYRFDVRPSKPNNGGMARFG